MRRRRSHRYVVAMLALSLTGCATTLDNKPDNTPASFVSGARPTAPATGGAVPSTGRGWDQSSVHVGVITENDAQQVAKSLGLSSLDPGDQEADARAMADQINADGGIYGRQLVLDFYNEATFALLASPDSQAAGACTHFTQDLPVVAVVNDVTIIDTPAFKACFAENRVPLFEGSQQPVDTEALHALNGYVISVLSPSYTDMAPTLVSRLKAEGYFTGWDASRGTPGAAPVKVGILTPHDQTGAEAAHLLSEALTQIGYPPVEIYSYSSSGAGSGTESAAAVQFHARGITHVIGTGLNTYLFMAPAQAQGYRPRYGVSTFNAPGVLLQNNVPKAQLTGALGIGVDPTGDVDAANDPGIISRSETRCLQTMHAAGQDFGPRRLAEAVALFDCDAFLLFRRSVVAGKGLSADAIIRGVQAGGPRFVPAETFRSGLGAGQFALAGAARDLGWNVPCQCFRYLSAIDHPVGGG